MFVFVLRCFKWVTNKLLLLLLKAFPSRISMLHQMSSRNRLQSISICYSYDFVDLLGNSPSQKSYQLAMEVKFLRCFVTKLQCCKAAMLRTKRKSSGYSLQASMSAALCD